MTMFQCVRLSISSSVIMFHRERKECGPENGKNGGRSRNNAPKPESGKRGKRTDSRNQSRKNGRETRKTEANRKDGTQTAKEKL